MKQVFTLLLLGFILLLGIRTVCLGDILAKEFIELFHTFPSLFQVSILVFCVNPCIFFIHLSACFDQVFISCCSYHESGCM